MRIAIGSLMQETNTFAPISTTLDTFRDYYLLYGDELFTGYNDAQVEVPAFLHVLAQAKATPVPLLAGFAAACGPLTRPTFDHLLDELLTRLKRALPVDGVLLALHGAMTVEDDPDAEGTLLEAVRSLVGSAMPIGVSLDLHGHITPRMARNATFMIGYQEYPHIDIYETGMRTAQLLMATLAEARQPTTALAKRPMIVSPVNARTTAEPLRRISQAAREMEASGRVLHASLFPVQPWMDVPDLGFAVVIVGDGDQEAAQAAADELADLAWDARAAFGPDLTPLPEAIRIGLEAPSGLTVVGDAGDAPTGGSAADNVAVLRELLAQGADHADRPSYLFLCDAEAARTAATAGIGSEITVQVGHKLSRSDGVPLGITGRVSTLSDGIYRFKGAGATGLRMRMGLTAVLAIGSIRLCIRSLPSFEWDPAMYYALGLDPTDAALVFVKSPSHFRASFEPLADRLLSADTPGPTCPNMRKLRFSRVTRPLYPLDDI
jgi:microcystin degradation protein MlrC